MTSVGAIRLFFEACDCSSFSDSLVSLLPSTLPLTELGRLMTPDMGVCGGVVQGRPVKEGLTAARLGTLPIMGVGLLITGWDVSVAIDEIEFDRVGL